MTAFAELPDLLTYVQRSGQSGEWLQAADQALDAASDSIRAACGWSITTETVQDTLWDCRPGGSVFLPTLHLTAVSLTSQSGRVFTNNVDFRWRQSGQVTFGRFLSWGSSSSLTFGCALEPLSVTYTHGFDSVPSALRQVCVEMAALSLQRQAQQPVGVPGAPMGPIVSLTEGPFSATYATPQSSSALLLDDRIRAYALPSIG